MNSFRPRSALACALLALGLVACGGGDDASDADGATTTTEASTTTTEATDETTTTTTGEETTTTTAPEGVDAPEVDLDAAVATLLLSLDEINAATDGTFEEGDYTPDTDGPPCGGEDPDDVFPPDVLVGTLLVSQSDQLAFQQEIRVYPTTDDASQAFALGIEGSSCGETEDGTAYSAPVDVTAQVGGDTAQAIQFSGPDVEGVLVVVGYSDAVVVFGFAGAPGAADAAGAPSPIDVAAQGMQKILDQIG